MDHPPPEDRKHFFDDPRNVQRLIRSLYVLCAVLVGLDLVIHRHLSFAAGTLDQEGWFGFYGVYGFVSCVVLVLVAREMRKLLMRREDYYD